MSTANGNAEGAPMLPAPGDAGHQKLHVGEKVALEDMGPVVVNEDGTVSQIANWSQMNQVSDNIMFIPQLEG